MKHYLLKILKIEKKQRFEKKIRFCIKTRFLRIAKLYFFENQKDSASSDAKTYPKYSYKIWSWSVN